MRSIELIEHELMVLSISDRTIEYMTYIEDVSKLFNSTDKFFRLVRKGTRFDNYYDGILSKEIIEIYGEYSFFDYLDGLGRTLCKELYYEYGNKYAIIRYSTDSCMPNYRVEFTTKSGALSIDRSARLSYKDAEQVRNYHHDLVKVVRLRKGYKKPTQKWIESEVKRQAGWKYSPKASQVLASHVMNHGIEV